MRHSPEIVEKARDLRRQQLSFYEIGMVLNIHNSTIRNWCYDLGINRHESLRINNEIRRKKIKEQDAHLVLPFLALTPENARLFAAIFYGCEGAKYPSTNAVDFVNLLRKGFNLDEEKFRVRLQIHVYHNYSQLKNFWSKFLGIPVGKFRKPTTTIPRGKMRRQNYIGTCSLRYLDNKIQLRLLGLFERFCNSGEVA